MVEPKDMTREALEKALAKWRGFARMYGCTSPEDMMAYIGKLQNTEDAPKPSE